MIILSPLGLASIDGATNVTQSVYTTPAVAVSFPSEAFLEADVETTKAFVLFVNIRGLFTCIPLLDTTYLRTIVYVFPAVTPEVKRVSKSPVSVCTSVYAILAAIPELLHDA